VSVVNFNNVRERQNVLFNLLDVDVSGGALHHDRDALAEDGDSCEEHNNREQVGAKRVSHPQGGEEVDAGGSDDDSDRHEHVAEHVQEGGVYVHVASSVLVVDVVVIMIVSVVVIVSVSVVDKTSLDILVLDLLLRLLVAVRVTMTVVVSMVVSMIVAMIVAVVVTTKMVVAVT